MPRLTVIIDNEAYSPALSSQHGLSIWLETGSSNIIFDTSRDGLFLRNAQTLGIPVSEVTYLILSHGHYDHTGGVPDLLDLGIQPQMIVGPEAWVERRSSHPIGIPWPQDTLSDLPLTINPDTCQIEPGIAAVDIGGTEYAASRHPNLQRLVDGKWEPDTFPDEQIVVLQTSEGLVVVTGCTHCGVTALIARVNNLSCGKHIHALIGGLHLDSSTPEDILNAARQLRDIEHVWVNHCTGSEAFSMLRDALGLQVEWAGAGFQTELPPLITP